MYDALRKMKQEWVSTGYIDLPNLKEALRIWELIDEHTKVEPTPQVVTRREIKAKLR